MVVVVVVLVGWGGGSGVFELGRWAVKLVCSDLGGEWKKSWPI